MSGNCKQTSGKLCSHSRDSNTTRQKNQPTLAYWVNDYLGHFGTCYQAQILWWGDRTLTWDAALERAWLSRFADGKMHPHQRRVSSKLAEGLNVSRQDGHQAQQFKTFAELHHWIESVTARVKGLGETTAYDVAQRLGMWLNLAPDLVYLHAGTAKGAAVFNITGKTTFLSDFPPEIQKLGATDAENFLCIYKDNLKSLSK